MPNNDVMTETVQGTALTKKDVNHSYWIWQFFSHANYNYERMQGGSFAACMSPIIHKLYPKKQDEVQGLQRHLVFFNTNPNFGTLIHGATIAMEEQRANGAEISDEAINSVKTGLMGPLAGIGDTLDQGIIIPIVVALGISIAKAGNVFGSLLVLILLPLILMLIAHYFYIKGYQLGGTAVANVLSGGKMQRLIGAASILGCTVMGGLISSYVSLGTTIKFNVGADTFDLQTQLFDAIMPNLLPLLVTLGVFALMRKTKLSSLKVMLILIVIAFVGGVIGIF
jgi:mannose PTS system EIID component